MWSWEINAQWEIKLKAADFHSGCGGGQCGLEKLMHNEKLNLKLRIFTEEVEVEVGNVVLRN